MSDNSTASTGGIGLSGATFLVFLVLRLTDHIDWAWYWVAAPLWMPPAAILGVVALFFLCIGLAIPFAWLADWRRDRKRARLRSEADAWRRKLTRD